MSKRNSRNVNVSATLVSRLEEIVAKNKTETVFESFTFEFASSLLKGIKEHNIK